MKQYINKNFPFERDLYGCDDIELISCSFSGKEDGESALKECNNIILNNCYMDLRYPLWHDNKVILNNVHMTENCRAALWYSNKLNITDSKLHGIKALRECNDIVINNCDIISPEFGWKSCNVELNNSTLTSEYAFFLASKLKLNNVTFSGKYSFQYVKDMEIENCNLNTKDAFWHAENVVVKNSIVKGEYLGWYSKNLTLINCHIDGTQPLCYCENLKLIDCTTSNCDLAFETSDVEATINGSILSIKNPKSGTIIVDEVISNVEEYTKYPVKGKVIVRKKY